MRRLIASLLAVQMAVLGLVPAAEAAGFRITAHGAKAMGMAGAFAGQADDPSAIYYNPAGITQLEGTQIQGGFTIIHSPGSEYEPFNSTTPTILPGGAFGTAAPAEIDARTFYLPTLFFTRKATDRLSLGFGTYTPFGLNLDWPDDWTGRQITTFSESKTNYFDFIAAYNILPWWSVSGGVIYARSKVRLSRTSFLPSPPFPPFSETLIQVDAEGWAPAFDVATHVRLGKRVTLGASYRHQAVVEHNGWIHLSGVGDFPASVKFALPSTFTTGIAVKPLDWWTLAFDWDFTYWESFRDLNLQVPTNPTVEAGLRDTSPFPNRTWKNSHIFRIGTELQVTQPLAVRLGYAYITTPIPDRTMDPVLPDSDRTSLTAGFGYKLTERLTLDFAYEYQHFHERAKNNEVLEDPTSPPAPPGLYSSIAPGLRANGTYNTDAHVFITQLKYIF